MPRQEVPRSQCVPSTIRGILTTLFWCLTLTIVVADEGQHLKIAWKENILTITGERIPGGPIEIWYLEAYCRAESHDADWGNHTVVRHQTQLLSANEDQTLIRLQCRVNDGLLVDHVIRSQPDAVEFEIRAHNPTTRVSEVHWAQPCVRVGPFTGCGPSDTDDAYAYVNRSFVFLDGKIEYMPTADWATEARYAPGQVWAAPGVSRRDVNPRPLNPHTPSHGLIGCVSADGEHMLAIAFEPYQELFQGVIRCLHCDFRLGGLEAGESLQVRGKIYVVKNDPELLLQRYAADFGAR